MIHVGIDLHSNNMVNVALNSNGEVIRREKLPACEKALDKFFGSFGESVQAVVECIPKAFGILAGRLVSVSRYLLNAGPCQDG